MSWYFLRHGQTRWNVEHRLQGTRDIPLNEKGREQAEVLRDRWRQEGLEFAAVYCSPLQRAVATAEIVTGLPRSRFILDERLLEMRFGAMEGAVYVKSSGHSHGSFSSVSIPIPPGFIPSNTMPTAGGCQPQYCTPGESVLYSECEKKAS